VSRLAFLVVCNNDHGELKIPGLPRFLGRTSCSVARDVREMQAKYAVGDRVGGLRGTRRRIARGMPGHRRRLRAGAYTKNLCT
jgi:hypothetical protein